MKKTAIYGIGAFGKIFHQLLGSEVSLFIDDYSQESSYQSVPIKKIEDLSLDTKVYVSVMQHSKKIENVLREHGFTDIMSFTDSIKEIPHILSEISKSNYLWLVQDTSKMLDYSKLKKVEKLLIDTKSKSLLSRMIRLRETLDSKYYIEPEDIEYFPYDVPIFDNLKYVNFVDCGAYTGDTISSLLDRTDSVKTTVSFEPDERNLLKLNKHIVELGDAYPEVNLFIYPAGVYDENKILRFSNNGVDSSSSFSSNSEVAVPVVSIDNTLFSANPNFIKMDIEGAEYHALIGAKKTIQKYKPNLAICLYHKPEDLWELPLLIHDIEPSYDMYIRVHEDLCLSTVLYCISRKNHV